MLLSNGNLGGLAPQALGETTPITTTGYFYGKEGLFLERQFATYSALYKAQPWVATVVDKVANAIARLPLDVWDSANGARTLDETSGYAKLIAKPCSTMSTYGFWRWVISTYEIYGEAFLYKLRDDNGKVIQLLPMHPSRTFVERDKETGRLTYTFTAGTASTGLFETDEENVIPFLRYNSDSLMRGHSRLEPLRSTLMNEDSTRRAMGAWWANMGRPSIVLQSEKPLKEAGRNRLADSFNYAHGGSGNVGKALVLEDGVTAHEFQLTAEEMAYVESRQLNRGEVCAVYDIPPPVVHILDNATFSNITEQMRSMYRDTMAPRIIEIESILDAYLRPEFGRLSTTKKAVFAVDEVLRGDIETRAATAVQLVTNGVAKPDELRPWFGLDQVGGVADKLYANSAMAELGTHEHPDPAPGPSETPDEPMSPDPTIDPAEPPETTKPPPPSNKHYRSIMGRLGRGQSMEDIRAGLLADTSAYEISELCEITKALSDAEKKVNERERRN